ncbi:SGNH/GDSL hydrolase family protein [Mediterraneibacter agrestimuris]|uniref:SGNH/GDSL hydrolase family protein n=1 Tax=Mediterraneibacter agrestimuris TaxID=2941333 RepID=UPI00203C6C4E|nr:hypothetical protein [Mediterraneibacter agrestimuris]
MAELLESTMLICFGLSWPMNLTKNIKAKSAKNMSLQFILLIIFGYVAGITAKIYTHRFNYVLVVYLLNLVVVSANVIVYFINRRYDRQTQKANTLLCKELSGKTENETLSETIHTSAPQKPHLSQGDDEMETYRELNSITEAGGVVLFGSNTFANLPLGELTQAYRITEPIYNRSIKDIRINQIENYLKVCLFDLNPRKIFVNLGDVDIKDESLDVENFISKYEWLLYMIHTKTQAEIYIVSIVSSSPEAAEINQRLQKLATQTGCHFLDATGALEAKRPTLRLFELIKVHMRNHPINYADAMTVGRLSNREREQVPNDGHSSPEPMGKPVNVRN